METNLTVNTGAMMFESQESVEEKRKLWNQIYQEYSGETMKEIIDLYLYASGESIVSDDNIGLMYTWNRIFAYYPRFADEFIKSYLLLKSEKANVIPLGRLINSYIVSACEPVFNDANKLICFNFKEYFLGKGDRTAFGRTDYILYQKWCTNRGLKYSSELDFAIVMNQIENSCKEFINSLAQSSTFHLSRKAISDDFVIRSAEIETIDQNLQDVFSEGEYATV